MTNGSGMVTDTYAYTAFGELRHQTGTTPNTYLYTGQQHDALTGLYSLRARYYAPSMGRFLSADTWAVDVHNPVELNRYVYAVNNPVRWVDPSGLTTMVMTSNALAAAITALVTTAIVQYFPVFIAVLLGTVILHFLAAPLIAAINAFEFQPKLDEALRRLFKTFQEGLERLFAEAAEQMAYVAKKLWKDLVVLYRGTALSRARETQNLPVLEVAKRVDAVTYYALTDTLISIHKYGVKDDKPAISIYAIPKLMLEFKMMKGHVQGCHEGELYCGFDHDSRKFLMGPVVIAVPWEFVK